MKPNTAASKMHEHCNNGCTKAIVQLKDTPLYKTIIDFIKNNEELLQDECIGQERCEGGRYRGELPDSSNSDECALNNRHIAQFYAYIAEKHRISCEAGMLIVERILTLAAFNRMKQGENPHNMLVNSKLVLYKWIRPEHLEIGVAVPDSVVQAFADIKRPTLPSAKIDAYMLAIRKLQQCVGPDVGQDQMFPALVYALIKTQIPDLALHFRVMSRYRREYHGNCNCMCTHGFKINVRCDCLLRIDWKREDIYYIVMALAALDFIAKIEFYNLRISVNEFNYEISMRIEGMKLDGKNGRGIRLQR